MQIPIQTIPPELPLTDAQWAELESYVTDLEAKHGRYIGDFNRLIQAVSADDEAEPSVAENTVAEEADEGGMPLAEFLADFGDSLFDAVTEQNRPVYHGQTYPETEAVWDALARPLFDAQREVVRAVVQQLIVDNKPAAVINAEMGTGKTMMSIAAAAAAHHAGLHRTLVLSPPHLVYKWRREILNTVPEARV